MNLNDILKFYKKTGRLESEPDFKPSILDSLKEKMQDKLDEVNGKKPEDNTATEIVMRDYQQQLYDQMTTYQQQQAIQHMKQIQTYTYNASMMYGSSGTSGGNGGGGAGGNGFVNGSGYINGVNNPYSEDVCVICNRKRSAEVLVIYEKISVFIDENGAVYSARSPKYKGQPTQPLIFCKDSTYCQQEVQELANE